MEDNEGIFFELLLAKGIEDATDGIHVVLRPDADPGAAAPVLVGGHEYWRETDDVLVAAASAKYTASGHVGYTRYVPVDAVAEASTAEAHAQREIAETDAARWRLHAEQTR